MNPPDHFIAMLKDSGDALVQAWSQQASRVAAPPTACALAAAACRCAWCPAGVPGKKLPLCECRLPALEVLGQHLPCSLCSPQSKAEAESLADVEAGEGPAATAADAAGPGGKPAKAAQLKAQAADTSFRLQLTPTAGFGTQVGGCAGRRAPRGSPVGAPRPPAAGLQPPPPPPACSRAPQVSLLSGRMLRQWVRNPDMLLSEAVQYVFMAVFVGLVWLQ